MSAQEVITHPAVCRTCGDPLLGFRVSKGGKNLPVLVHVQPMVEQLTIKAAGGFEFHVHVVDRSPAQIDATLYEIYLARSAARARLDYELKDFDRQCQREAEGRPTYGRHSTEIESQIADVKAWLRKLEVWAEFYEGEFERRGGWLRYFLVTNSGGHVHREMTCSSCYPTTEYAWLVDLADCDEAAMVEQYGMTACTVCFPDAPTLPGWARDEEAEAAKKAKVCPGSGDYPTDVSSSSRYVKCSVCGEIVSRTKNGLLRKHNRKNAEVGS